jgi:hypothetical protein
MPDDITQLPTGGTLTLVARGDDRAARVDEALEVGAVDARVALQLVIDGPATLPMGAITFAPQGRETNSIIGPGPTAPPDTAVGAHHDGNGGSGTGVRIVPSTSRNRTALKAGDCVYRVVEIDPPPDKYEPHTWKAACVVVERASKRQVKLKTPFSGIARTVFEPSALGRVFFETPLQAIRFFLTEQRLEIEALDRRRKETERAIAWATNQEKP